MDFDGVREKDANERKIWKRKGESDNFLDDNERERKKVSNEPFWKKEHFGSFDSFYNVRVISNKQRFKLILKLYY